MSASWPLIASPEIRLWMLPMYVMMCNVTYFVFVCPSKTTESAPRTLFPPLFLLPRRHMSMYVWSIFLILSRILIVLNFSIIIIIIIQLWSRGCRYHCQPRCPPALPPSPSLSSLHPP